MSTKNLLTYIKSNTKEFILWGYLIGYLVKELIKT